MVVTSTSWPVTVYYLLLKNLSKEISFFLEIIRKWNSHFDLLPKYLSNEIFKKID
jgi:hypothetical protein